MVDEEPKRPDLPLPSSGDPCRSALRTIPPAFAWCDGEQAIVKLRDRFPQGSAPFLWWAELRPEMLLEQTVTVLHGPTGAGKTSAAIIAMRHACSARPATRKAIGARFIPAREICPPADSGLPSRLQEALGAALLILDDVGQELGVSGWERDQRLDRMRFLFATLFDRKTPMLMTTALEWRRFGEMYDGGCERRYWTEADVRVIAMQAPPVKVRT